MKKILLIGKTSQLGTEIIKDANEFNYEVFGFDSKEVDITNVKQVLEQLERIKPDIVINTGAYHIVPKCEENPVLAMNVNFIAVRNLAKFCKERNIIFLTYTTDYVFDGEKRFPYEEDDLPNPIQIYGLSKLAGEYAALQIYPEKSFVIRTCGVYGRKVGSTQKKGNFFLNIIKEAQGKETIEVSSEQIVNPTYAGDLSKATLKLLNSNATPGIYHLTNEGFCSWAEFAQEIFRQGNINTRVIPVDRSGTFSGVKKPLFSALKNTKAKALGIELSAWQDGIKSYLKYLAK